MEPEGTSGGPWPWTAGGTGPRCSPCSRTPAAATLPRLPAITWFSASGHINGGIRGVVRAEARDDEAATNLRDVVRGFLALAKMSAGSRPELQLMMQSLELGGTGKTVALSFSVPAEVFDVIGAVTNKGFKPAH